MKTIGLIGGMSWESSAHYYSLVNRMVAEAVAEESEDACIRDVTCRWRLRRDSQEVVRFLVLVEAGSHAYSGPPASALRQLFLPERAPVGGRGRDESVDRGRWSQVDVDCSRLR